MRFSSDSDGIIAPSTCSLGNSALALIRISGFSDLDDLRPAFKLAGPIEPRKVYYTQVLENHQALDDVCITYFKAPHSFTGENVLEISIHGNLINQSRIINFFQDRFKLRFADPGEFSYRALKNKNMSL